MDNLPAILDSFAKLAWPIIVIVVLLGFRNNIIELIETAKSRKFTVKVAGNELTMEELSEQQRNIITDLQQQLTELQKQIQPLLKAAPVKKSGRKQKSAGRNIKKTAGAKSILWVMIIPRITPISFRDCMNKALAL